LYFWFHAISFGSHEETVARIFGAEHCDSHRYFFLGIFVYDPFAFVPALCETEDRNLDDVAELISDAFSQKFVSTFIFGEITLQYELIQFV